MKHTLITMLLAGMSASIMAAPACLPKSPSEIRGGVTKDGAWAYWWCSDTAYAWRAVPMKFITSNMQADVRAYMAGTYPEFVNKPMTLPANSPLLTPLHAQVLLAIKAEKAKPPVAAPR